MKIIKWIFVAIIFVFLVVFFVYNFRLLVQPVKFELPFTDYESYSLPLFLYFALLLVLGYLIGMMNSFFKNFRLKRELKDKTLEIESLNKQLHERSSEEKVVDEDRDSKE